MLAVRTTNNIKKCDLNLLQVFRRAINLDTHYDLESFYKDIISGNFQNHKIYKNKNRIEIFRKLDNELIFTIIE